MDNVAGLNAMVKLQADSASLDQTGVQIQNTIQKGISAGIKKGTADLKDLMAAAFEQMDISALLTKQLRKAAHQATRGGWSASLGDTASNLGQQFTSIGDLQKAAMAKALAEMNSSVLGGIPTTQGAKELSDALQRLTVSAKQAAEAQDWTTRLSGTYAHLNSGIGGSNQAQRLANERAIDQRVMEQQSWVNRLSGAYDRQNMGTSPADARSAAARRLANERGQATIDPYELPDTSAQREAERKRARDTAIGIAEAARRDAYSAQTASTYDRLNAGTTPADAETNEDRRRANNAALDAERDATLYGVMKRNKAHSRQRLIDAADFDKVIRTSDSEAKYDLLSRSPEEWAEYEANPQMRKTMDRRRDRASKWANNSRARSENRFIYNNIGFGIDDAIQSYQYGGIGASIRAASNNMTAVASMAISNPAIAAATVVGLSLASAAIPVVLRNMGIDLNEAEVASKGAADKSAEKYMFSQSGASYGRRVRGQVDADFVRSESNTALGMIDSYHQRQRDWDAADSIIKSNVLSGTTIGDMFGNDTPESIARATAKANGLSPDKEAELLQALKFQETYNATSPLQKQATIAQLGRAQEAFGSLLTNLPRTEKNAIINEKGAIARYQSESIQAYNDSVRAEASAKRAEIEARFQHLGPEHRAEKEMLLMQVNADMHTELSQANANQKTVEQNSLTRKYAERDFVDNALGFGSSALHMRERNRDYNRDSIKNDRTLTDLEKSIRNAANEGGFNRFREGHLQAMESKFEIHDAVGAVAGAYAAESRALQDEFATGSYTEAEKANLTTKFKNKYKAAMIDAKTPSGTEQFLVNAVTVGSAQDRALEARMLGNFGREPIAELNEVNGLSLRELEKMNVTLEKVHTALEMKRLGF
jgi:hypothetical protein